MKQTVFVLSLAVTVLLISCSSKEVETQALHASFKEIKVVTKTAGGKNGTRVEMVMRLRNRTEHTMQVGFVEATVYSTVDGKALLRFRPIVPEAYGTMSLVQLLPKQTKDFPVVSAPNLSGFDLAEHPQVIIEMALTTSDGFRTKVRSAQVPVTKE